jgi:hypothetical protein
MCATCFGPFSSHHQDFQYKNHLKEDTMKIKYNGFSYNIKIQNITIYKIILKYRI